MLRWTTEEGKDWHRLLPYVLFAYREVPQASTGFSPFELVYGRQMRGPLDVICETWEGERLSGENVITNVLTMRERLEALVGLVGENMKKANDNKKKWYDQHAREWELEVGSKVLVLPPTSTSKLKAQWQGPYSVVA